MDGNKYYVYLHKRKSDGTIFYVGKGCGVRAKVKSGRSKHWLSTVKKHGYIIDFAFTDLTSDEAKRIEKELIKNLRQSGASIVNISSGGDGGLDCEMYTKETKEKMRAAKLGKKQMPGHAAKSASAKIGKKQPKSAVDYVIGLKKKKVINSDGEVFESASFAAREISAKLGIKASQGTISMACRGERFEAYGKAWSYDLSKLPKLRKRVVKCSNGMSFNSVSAAAKWVKSWRGKSVVSNITNSIFSNKKAYGFYWCYNEDDLNENT